MYVMVILVDIVFKYFIISCIIMNVIIKFKVRKYRSTSNNVITFMITITCLNNSSKKELCKCIHTHRNVCNGKIS